MEPIPGHRRILALDIARSLALLAMACFHFGVDLELYGLATPGMTTQGIWWWAARIIAGSFIFLAGVSLWLAHGRGIRWPAFLRRLAMIVVAAALVTLGTWFAMPQVFVWFGILHAIAVFSLAGLCVLRLPVWSILAAAAVIAWIGNSVQLAAFDHPALWWTGLADSWRPTMDFEPFFPWAAPFIAGIGVAKLVDSAGLWDGLRGPGSRLTRALAWPGQHSLAVYLIHQPVLLAGFGALRWIGWI